MQDDLIAIITSRTDGLLELKFRVNSGLTVPGRYGLIAEDVSGDADVLLDEEGAS